MLTSLHVVVDTWSALVSQKEPKKEELGQQSYEDIWTEETAKCDEFKK